MAAFKSDSGSLLVRSNPNAAAAMIVDATRDHDMLMVALNAHDAPRISSKAIRTAINGRNVPVRGLTVKMSEETEGEETRPACLACLQDTHLPNLLHLRLVGLRLVEVPMSLSRFRETLVTLNLYVNRSD